MKTITRAKLPALSAAVVFGAAMIAAGCGSSNSASSSSASSAAAAASPNSSTSSAASNAAASGTVVKLAHGAHGAYLTSSNGRALYLWVADSNGKSSCSGACAQAWPPLTTKAAPIGSAGVQSAMLATITRSDGTKQVAYDGHPLYFFAGDTGAGTTTGQGNNGFGAKWWLVAASGHAITTGGASGGSAAGSSSSSSGGSWG
jgi:predicted lipoprotein with Yx(FWY)xxD motif